MRVRGQTRTVVPESAQRLPVRLAAVVIRGLWDEGSLTHQSITGKYCALESRLPPYLTVSLNFMVTPCINNAEPSFITN